MCNLVELRISTFKGLSFNAEHYYGHYSVHTRGKRIVDEKTGNVSIRYSSEDNKHPHDGEALYRTLTSKDASYLNKKDFNKAFPYKRGDVCSRFDSREDLINVAIKSFANFFDPEKDLLVFEIEYDPVYAALAGPKDDVEYINKYPEYIQQHKLLYEKYMLKN